MKRVKKILLWAGAICLLLYVVVCVYFYTAQEHILFLPKKLDKNYVYKFPGQFKEMNINAKDGSKLNALWFGADSAKGLIFYVHGNAGALDTWGDIAPTYTALKQDLFILDYRGYGKSDGSISSEQQLYEDVQTAYDVMKAQYGEDKITILGYSIGTGPAAMLAAHNHPKKLILQAPYYSMMDMMNHEYSFLPKFILKFPLRTDEFIKQTKAPIVIFHGDVDEVIYYGSALKLKEEFKAGDTLITIKGLGHNGYRENADYLKALKTLF